MSRVFKITPKRIIRRNGTTLTPEMEVIVTTAIHTFSPFYNGAKEIIVQYEKIYGFDYRKAGCNPNEFNYKALD